MGIWNPSRRALMSRIRGPGNGGQAVVLIIPECSLFGLSVRYIRRRLVEEPHGPWKPHPVWQHAPQSLKSIFIAYGCTILCCGAKSLFSAAYVPVPNTNKAFDNDVCIWNVKFSHGCVCLLRWEIFTSTVVSNSPKTEITHFPAHYANESETQKVRFQVLNLT